MDRNEICDRFLGSLSHSLYPYQEEALLSWFTGDSGLMICAPTAMGKTLLAEAAIFESLHSNRRMYYTSPLIALTDQKFREFQAKAEEWGFPRQQVGLITGNRRENPDALVRVVVAEILLNHLLSEQEQLHDVHAVVMDEFHYFNDLERGIVWELSLVLLPTAVRVMLLSATVGNPVEFLRWAGDQHGRKLQLIQTTDRRVPLEFRWIGDQLLTEHLPEMVSGDDSTNRTPALVFCFNRDECWEVAERLKGVTLIDQATRQQIEAGIAEHDLTQGAGVKLKQLLIRGLAVHHAGVLPRYKEIVESLFLRKLIPFVVCTETLAAGVNLPERSVVLSTLLHGKPREKKLIAPSSAHQMFGRAGRPQFDAKGYVHAFAHEDDVKIVKWRRKYEQIDPKSKDPGLLRMRKELERKKPTRRTTEQYWTEGQLQTLIKSSPAKLYSRSMIPYGVLIYLLMKTGSLHDVRAFLAKRFTSAERIENFELQLGHMIANLAKFGYLALSDDGRTVVVGERIGELTAFRTVDPLYGAFLAKQLVRANYQEKLQALESVLQVPPAIELSVRLPQGPPGPLQLEVVQPALIALGAALVSEEGAIVRVPDEDEGADYWDEKPEPRPLTLPEMLKIYFDAHLASPEDVFVQPKWVAGGVFEYECDFHKFIRNRDLVKNEGIVLRHLLRLVIFAGEMLNRSDGDPDYARIGELATRVCQAVDPRYADRFLAAEEESRQLPLI